MLTDGCEVFELAIPHLLVEATDCVLVKVWRVSMMLQSGLIGILLVDQNCTGLPFDEVGDVAYASWFLARGRGEVAEDLGDLFRGRTAQTSFAR